MQPSARVLPDNNFISSHLDQLTEDARHLRSLSSALCHLCYQDFLDAHRKRVKELDIALEQLRLEGNLAVTRLMALEDSGQPYASSFLNFLSAASGGGVSA